MSLFDKAIGVRLRFTSFVFFIVFLVVGCAQSNDPDGPVVDGQQVPQDWAPLDVSDVSFLWPTSTSLSDLMPVTGSERLLPNPETLDQLIVFSLGRSPQGPSQFRLTNPLTGQRDLVSAPTDSWGPFRSHDLRIVSARIDDCGTGMRQSGDIAIIESWQITQGQVHLDRGHIHSCKTSLRLVAQPPQGDNAVHLIYSYDDRQTLFSIMADLQTLKSLSPRPTNGRPLGPHPGLTAEGGRGPFSRALKAFIRKYAQPEKLDTLALLSTNESVGGSQWNFFEANPVTSSDGRRTWRMRNLHALQGSPISQGFTVNTSDPTRMGPPSLANINGNDPSLRAIEANFDPRRSFASSTDCKSCHFATQLAARLSINRPDQFQGLFSRSSSVLDTPGVTSFPHSQALSLDPNNFRALGWFENQATVSGWAAKKSGTVASSLNRRYLNQDVGPGFRCSGRQHLVMRCLLENAGRPSRCLTQICEQPSR